ncbi:Outer membrane lipoprotein-sorting protein [hydrothermal vent metagenome]|uniref:Outer membrane lipoprotein-sorting protein n=1 Tax=hydrothermal vent metagenome TaxID=652676 RepID=A0A3B0WSA6_9ZZZZ
MKKPLFTTLGFILTFSLFSAHIYAQIPEEKGLAIAIEADKRDNGWGDQTSNIEMILLNRQGESSERKIRSKALEIQGDGDKSLTIFDTPRDLKGTAFLTFSHIQGADDQWLYLPALKRVKRISSRNKSGPFMGSEFAYEDMSSQEVEKYTYKYLQDEPCGDGLTCFVSERYPIDKFSGYTKQVIWLDTEEYRPIKIDFYDRKNALLKTLTLTEYQQYLGQYWRPHKLEMVNHQTGKKSIVNNSNYQFKTGLTDADFNKSKLKRLR